MNLACIYLSAWHDFRRSRTRSGGPDPEGISRCLIPRIRVDITDSKEFEKGFADCWRLKR
jgi:hypothetical protein